ncbi:MAG: glycosyltransferase family 4 protein [Thermoguttaceae bacterium]
MTRPIRICHLCSGHAVSDDRVFARECVSLARAGYDVHLIASQKEAAEYTSRGVQIHAIPFAKGRWRRYARCAMVGRMAASLAPDLFHVHEPDLLAPAMKAAGTRPVIWDAHESYRDMLMDSTWIPKHLRGGVRLVWDWHERRLVRRCAAVIAVTEPIAQYYRKYATSVHVVANFPDLSVWENMPPVPRDANTCVFTGAISPIRGLLEVVRAIGILKARGVTVRLELAGPDAESFVAVLLEEASRLGISDLVAYHGCLAPSDAQALMQAAGIGLVTYLPYKNNMIGWPIKLFQCMAHGLPFIYSDFPSYREVAEASGSGIAVDPTDPNSIANALEQIVKNPKLAQEMGDAGKRAVFEKFNWNREEAKLLAIYEAILSK